MSLRTITELERIRFRKGQHLASRDLRDDQDFEVLLRRIHNRYLHDTWGIAAGLQVENRDAESVLVRPGIAYDGHGREVVLSKPATIRLPPLEINDVQDLVIRYKESSEFPSRRMVGSVCLAEESGLSGNLIFASMLEQPVFLWRAPGTSRLGEEIPLARVKRIQILSAPTIDYSNRRSAGRLARPHVGYGSTLFSLSSMIGWLENRGTNGLVGVGLQIEVDTSAASFASTPCYVFTSRLQTRLDERQISMPVPFFESIANARPNGFIYRLMAVNLLIPPVLSFLGAAALELIDIGVQWLGIEHIDPEQSSNMDEGGTR
jgi:hypothetical protein